MVPLTLYFTNYPYVKPPSLHLHSHKHQIAVLVSSRAETKLTFVLICDLLLPGYYGDQCTRPCPKQCASGYCHRIFGYCDCAPGLFGPSCNQPCPTGSWGPNCKYRCQCPDRHSTGCNPKVCIFNTFVYLDLRFYFKQILLVA